MNSWNGAHQRALRKSQGISPEALAIGIGRSAAMVLDYERGRVQPSLPVATGIAAALDVDITELLTGGEVTTDA